jgi:hypothetical protein
MKATQMAIDLSPLFPVRIHVGFKDILAFEKYIFEDLSEKATRKHINAIIKNAGKASGLYNYQYHGSFTIFVYDNEGKHNFNLENIISHEVFHITMNIGRYLGVEFSGKSEEFFAYVNGYINSVILSNKHMYEDDPVKEDSIPFYLEISEKDFPQSFTQNTTD